MSNIIILKALLSAWETLGFRTVHACMSEDVIAAAYWYGAKCVFFHVDFRFGAPRYFVKFTYWDIEQGTSRGYDYDTRDLHRAFKKAYVFQELIKALDDKK